MNDLFCWELKFKYCSYSKSLLKKIFLQNKKSDRPVDVLLIKKAIYYAKKYHDNQKRLSGEPYYSHPLAVAELVASYSFKTDILVTSILHDVIEDTTLTKEMIAYIFDPKIAENVDSLTRIKIAHKISVSELLDLLYLKEKEDLLLIKYIDRLHNMTTIAIKQHEKILETTEETIKKFISLGVYLETSIPTIFSVHEKLLELCYKAIVSNNLNININSHSNQQCLDLLDKACQGNFQLPFLAFRNKKPLS